MLLIPSATFDAEHLTDIAGAALGGICLAYERGRSKLRVRGAVT